MKKYTIDDLIIGEPIPETKKSERKPKGKYTTVALIAIILIVGVFLAKMITGSSTDITATEESKIADVNTGETIVPIEQEAQKVADELSIAITELDSLAPPTAEPKNDEILIVKTEELIEQKEETIVPTEQEVQKFADELSAAAAETKSLEPAAIEPKNDEIATAKTEELVEQKEETIVPVEQEAQKISDVLSNITAETKSPEPSAEEPDIDAIIAARIEELPEQKEERIVPAEQEAQKVADEPSPTSTETKSQDTIKNSTPDTIVAQKEPIVKEEKAEQPKQELESIVTKTPDTKTEDIEAAKQEEAKVNVANEKKIQSERKPKSKPKGLFDAFSKKTKYYVQVGTFKGNPSSRFLSKIKNSGFNYRIIRSKNSSARKVIIGPYNSSSSAKKAIGKINKAIGVKGVVVK